MVGEQDGFDPDPDQHEAKPSDDLLERVASNAWAEADVDSVSINSEFVHTFQWKNCHHVSRALLEIKVRALSSATSGQPNTDTLSLWFTGTNSTEMSYQLWDSNTQTGDTVTILLDLGALPAQGSNLTAGSSSGTESLLDEMNATGYLDVRIQDDTSVDYTKLILCCQQPGCECGDWEGATVEGDWFAECGETVELTPDEIQGPVTVDPHYSCVGVDCGSGALSLYWEVNGPGGFHQSSGGQQAPPVEFAPQGSGTYRVKMEPSCAGKGCCEPCVIQILIEESTCECAADHYIALSGSDWEQSIFPSQCGQSFDIPAEVCAVGELTIAPEYFCHPAEECNPAYVIDVPDLGISNEPFNGEFILPLDELENCARVCIYAFCDGVECEPCCFEICCAPDCVCGDWEGVSVEGTHVDCGGSIQLGPGDIQGPVTVEPHFECIGAACPPDPLTFFWEVTGPSFYESSGSFQLLSEIEFAPQAAGTYTLQIMPACNGVGCCDPCRVSIEIKPEDPEGCVECDAADKILCVWSDQNSTWVDVNGVVQHAVVVNAAGSYTTVPAVPNTNCHAQWIWREANSAGYGAPPGTETFTTMFNVPPGYVVQEACLEFSADDEATAEINGVPIGVHVGSTGTSGGADERTTILNISPSLFHIGSNQLQVTVADAYEVYTAGIWCLKVCLGKCTSCVWPPDDLVAWWPFNHCNQEWQDGHHEDWTAVTQSCNGAALEAHPDSASGVRAGAIDVGNTVDSNVPYAYQQNVAVAAHHHDLDFSDVESFTIDCWIKPTDNLGTFVDKREPTIGSSCGVGTGYALGVSAAGTLQLILSDMLYTSNLFVPALEWSFVAVAVDQTDQPAAVHFVVNDMLETLPHVPVDVRNTADLWFGKDHLDENASFGGLIDEAEIYERALRFEELQEIYHAGSCGKCKKWGPGKDWKMHHPQWPDWDGWDVEDPDWESKIRLADDWVCTESGPIAAITFWGSWQGDHEGSIEAFRVQIARAQDCVEGPGEILWEQDFGYDSIDVLQKGGCCWQGWLPHPYFYDCGSSPAPCACDQVSSQDHEYFYRYGIERIEDPFIQEEGETYWLIISPLGVEDGAWAWKSSRYLYGCGGMWFDPSQGLWLPLVRPDTDQDGQLDCTRPIDLSFIIHDGPIYTCECGSWDWDEVDVNGHDVPCGGTAILTAPGPISIAPNYHCYGSEDCPPAEYVWTITGPGGPYTGGPSALQTIDFIAPSAGSYGVTITPICDGDECPPCRFKIEIESGPCECVGWHDEMILVESETGWGDIVYGCPVQINLPPEVCAAEFLTITPQYLCDPMEERCPWYEIDVPQWGYHEDFDGSLETFPVHMIDGCVDVSITAWCGEQPCDTCRFTLCCEACECVGWSDEIIHIASPVGWETSVYECPQAIELPREVCASEFLMIVPHYACDPPGPECRVSHVIDVPQWGLHEPFVDQYELTDLAQLAECDQFTDVIITAFCGEMACERCVLKLCCEQRCACDTWQDHDGDGMFDVMVNGWVVNQIDELHVTASDFPLQVAPGYTCQGNCLPSYECWITGGMTVGDLNGVIQLQYSHFGGAGMYGCVITPRCGSHVCDPLRFTLVIEEKPQPCECVGWSDEIIHIGSPIGWETSVYKCPETIELPPEVCASEVIEITPHYVCDPPDPECRVSYIIDVPQWGLHEEFIDSFPLPLGQMDECVTVCVTAFCGDVACDECCFTLCCESSCECVGWSDGKILIGSPVGWGTIYECRTQIDLPPDVCASEFLEIVPQYWCDPLGSGCPSYMIDVPQWGLHEEFIDSFLLPLGQMDECVMVCVTAFCGDVACDECCFTLCCEPGCECSRWGEVDVNGQTVTCGGDVTLTTDTAVTIEPDYRCFGDDCATRFIWKIEGPEGFHLLQGGEPIGFVPPVPGTYEITLTPTCNGATCPSCEFLITIEEPGLGCTCGQWTDYDGDGLGDIRIEGRVIGCGGDIALAADEIEGPVTINPSYGCGPGCGPTFYAWTVSGPGGYSRGSGDGLVRGPIEFDPSGSGSYLVTLTPYCDGQVCGPNCGVTIELGRQALADLVVTKTVSIPELPRVEEPFGVEVTVANRGAADSARFVIDLAGDSRTDSKIVPELAMGASTTVVFLNWTCSGDAAQWTATADARGEIDESSETNNTRTGQVICHGTPPLPMQYRWEFATFEGGGLKVVSRDMPESLQRELATARAVDAELVSSTLPPLAGFTLNLSSYAGTLTGVLPSGPAFYELTYELYTASRGAAGLLDVLIEVKGEAQCDTPYVDLSTGAARWEVLAPNAGRYVPVQPTLPNANWVQSPNRDAVWVDHDGTSAGSGWVPDLLGTYEYRVSFEIDAEACCGDCPLTFQYAADDRVQFFLDTPRQTYELCEIDRGCCGPEDEAYRVLRMCSVNLCDLAGGSGIYTLRARVENDQTVTGLLIIGGVRCP